MSCPNHLTAMHRDACPVCNPKQHQTRQQLARLPTAEEIAVLREAYAETYPVRPLLNEIDRLNAALEWIRWRSATHVDAITKARGTLERAPEQ